MTTSGRDRDGFRGQVDVAEVAITDLVTDIVRGCYGVVGIGHSSRRGLAARISRPWLKSLISIDVREGRVRIAVPIILEYGTPVAAVARNVIQAVGFQIEQTLGLPVERVDVHIAGLRHGDVGGRRDP